MSLIFNLLTPFPYTCSAYAGMTGGEQPIFLTGLCSISKATVSHEIGHAVGLAHEQQRKDRDQHLMLFERGLEYLWRGGTQARINPGSLNQGPYDYASLMHYPFPSTVLFLHRTIPPGMLVRGWGDPNFHTLSVGDIDGVARMYGEPPDETTITTNPPGLDIIVDGERVRTPASFYWEPGSKHRLEAPSPQTGLEEFYQPPGGSGQIFPRLAGDVRFVFGRWTDDGSRNRLVTADPDTTWYQASFIVQRRVVTEVEPEGAGRVTIRPESPDGFYTFGTRLEVSAKANPGGSYKFKSSGGIGFRDYVGAHSNPKFLTVPARVWSPGSGTIRASFDTEPCFIIDSNVKVPITLYFTDHETDTLRGSGYRGWDLPARVCDSSPAFIQLGGEGKYAGPWDPTSPHTFYRFLSWSDGGAPRHWITPTPGGKLTLNLDTLHAIRVESRVEHGGGSYSLGGGRIEFSPPPEEFDWGGAPGTSREPSNTYYLDGTWAQLTAVPDEGFRFMGWGGAVSGTRPVKSLLMDGFQSVTAYFSRRPHTKREARPPVRAHPRAFTFIAELEDPEPQRFRLTNIGDRRLDYRIDSDQDWLGAFPDQGILGEGESAEITVTAMNHGMPMDTHTGTLTVGERKNIFHLYGMKSRPEITIPVTFAVINPEGDSPENSN